MQWSPQTTLELCWRETLERMNLKGPQFEETPARAAKAFTELTSGYREDPQQYVKLFPSEVKTLVVIPEITIASLCAHHVLPYFGKCCIGYVPNGQILGVSKFSRIVRSLSRKLTVQEELTADIARFLMKAIRPLGVIVEIRAKHTCMMLRGREETSAYMVTADVAGIFQDDFALKSEFYQLLAQRSDLI